MKQARTLDAAKVKLLLANLKNDRERAMCLLSVKAGLRAKEIAGLTWDAVNLEDGLLRLSVTKGNKFREVPIASDLKAALQALQETARGPHVFENTHNRPGAPLTAIAVAAWFKHLYQVRMGWEGFSSHSGRRTAITQWARKCPTVGASLKDVQSLAGHSDLKTTSRYIETDPEAQRKLVE